MKLGFSQTKEQKNHLILWLLVILIVASLLLSVLSVKNLEWEDHISIGKGTFIFFYGLIFFTTLYSALNYFCTNSDIGKSLIKKYKLTKETVKDINNKQVSAVQAFFCCITGMTVCCYSCRRDMMKSSHYISEAYAWFGAAYFLYDIWSMYDVQSATGALKLRTNDSVRISEGALTSFLRYVTNNPVIIGHHVFIGAFGFLVITWLRGGLGDCFFGFVYLMEASTPFVSLRGILSKMGLKSSKIYVANGLIMLATFFVCRVAMFPYVIYMYSRAINLDFISALHTLPRGCKISILILLLPQIYWFHLMLVGATRALKPKKHANNGTKYEHTTDASLTDNNLLDTSNEK